MCVDRPNLDRPARCFEAWPAAGMVLSRRTLGIHSNARFAPGQTRKSQGGLHRSMQSAFKERPPWPNEGSKEGGRLREGGRSHPRAAEHPAQRIGSRRPANVGDVSRFDPAGFIHPASALFVSLMTQAYMRRRKPPTRIRRRSSECRELSPCGVNIHRTNRTYGTHTSYLSHVSQ
ncbi:hypothetical protein Mal15_09900 [Stieleria maiorica]|uniref:Uncharacterized protein n=1 Tax=Stieleria maiorica TaxID=2795974 RepID=A0A5B9MA69_9BACT|nr:hypothetical protein Mal15_09900 [Stieleria maiorica]